MRRNSFLGLTAGGFHRLAYVEWGDPMSSRVAVCVHGLTRTGRDFDPLAQALAAEGWRVVCPDMPGRGESDWLAQPADYDFPVYLNDLVALLARLQVDTVDWIGTSMGGLLGMTLAAKAGTPLRRLVLNDVGAVLSKQGLERIRGYVGLETTFESRPEAEARLRALLAGFGPLTEPHFAHLADHSLKPAEGGGVRFHYDPAIGTAMRAAPLADIDLWPLWDAVRCPVLLLHGAESDLLTAETAAAMTGRGPACRLVTLPGIGHAPSLMPAEQISVIVDWLRS